MTLYLIHHYKWLTLILLSSFSINVYAQSGIQSYLSYEDLSPRLQRLKNKKGVNVRPLGTSFGNRTIWVVELNKNKDKPLPGLCIIGGVDGRYLYTVDAVTRLAEQFADAPDSLAGLLKNHTLYFIPNANPDALQQAYLSLKYERNVNDRPVDADRDGRTDEDGFEDLNGDKIISYMRVKDSAGTWREHPDDPRVLIPADLKKGQRGTYKLLLEGLDNDKDGQVNEDPPGGVSLNRNFTFEYPWFQPDAGKQSFSEKETRAIGDFLFNEWNVYSVFVFGPNNNLSPVWVHKPATSDATIPTTVREKDATAYALAAKLYNDQVKATKYADSTAAAGDALRWAYFHYGRLALGTPGWWLPALSYKKDSTLSDTANARIKKRIESDNRYVKYLYWLEQNKNLSEAFMPWKAYNHPDFPNKSVEIGGFLPFSYYNPPYSAMDTIVSTHFNFFTQFLKQAPRLSLQNLKKERISADVYKIEVELYNSGLFPTDLQIAEKFNYTKRITYDAKPEGNISVLAGKVRGTTDALAGNEARKFSWLIKGNGKLNISFSTPTAGNATLEIKID